MMRSARRGCAILPGSRPSPPALEGRLSRLLSDRLTMTRCYRRRRSPAGAPPRDRPRSATPASVAALTQRDPSIYMSQGGEVDRLRLVRSSLASLAMIMLGLVAAQLAAA